jgi:Tfp pilus assembly major pilin PilA
MKRFILVFLALSLLGLGSYADIYIKSNNHTGEMEMMGQKTPAKDEISETWIGKDVMRTETKGKTFIITAQKVTIINDAEKTYLEADLPIDFKKLLPAEAEQMMGAMKVKLTINPTTEKKQIGKWNCTGYDMTMATMMGEMKGKIWASKDVPFDWKKIGALYKNMMAASSPIEGVEEYQKVEGYQIGMDMNASMMGANINVEVRVLEIAEKSAPANAYSVPAGYKKVDKLSMGNMMGGH